MNKVLVIVEGEVREKDFLNRYKEVKKINNDLEIVPYRQNIKELYRICSEYIFDGIKPDNILDILKVSTNIKRDDLKLLDSKFTDIYLIFDLDLQNKKENQTIKSYFFEIGALIDFF